MLGAWKQLIFTITYDGYRKATRQIVDAWLVSHATPTSSSIELSSPTHTAPSRSGSGATTPVRKISAHEFERGGLLKPIISTIDGTPTFLTGSDSTQGTVGPGNSPTPGRPQRRSRHELRQLDEKELIFELVSSRLSISMLRPLRSGCYMQGLISV